MPYQPPYLGTRPKHAEIWTLGGQRTCQILLPPATKPETAERAVRQSVQRWVENLEQNHHLVLTTDVDIEGPYFCPFLTDPVSGESTYGKDMWLATARFTSTKPRLVKEDVPVATRRMAEDVGVGYEQYRSQDQRSLPEDAHRQLAFVDEHRDQVYDDLRSLKEKEADAATYFDEGGDDA